MKDHLTAREQEILEILKRDPMISQDELAEKLKITRSSAAVHISNLMRKGYITGRGYIFNERSGILVVGLTVLEIWASSGHHADNNAEAGQIEFAFAGNGCLLALELARRHLESNLITFLGRDAVGEQIYDHLLQKGVKVQNSIRSAETPTRKRLVYSGPEGTASQVEAGGGSLTLIPEAILAREELIRTAKILLIDGDLPADTLSYLASKIIEHGIISSAVNCPLSLLKEQGLLAHPQFFLVCTDDGLAAQMKIVAASEPEELFPVCRQIVDEGLYALVVIFRDQGLILATEDETVFLPASPLQATGNTLSVTAGIAEGLASGYRVRMAVRMAMANE
ncbi:MAG: PfkB family carbohydrate kinase [Thermacetogeniaceae bacterium]